MRKRDRFRCLQQEQLEMRRVLTLPATQNFAEGDTVVYNGPTVDSVNDTLSFDAFIDFAGDTDSYFFAPQFSGTYTIDVGDFGNTVDPEVAVYDASTGAQVGYNDDLSQFNDDAQLSLNLTADTRYIIAVADQPGTTAGNVSISVTAPFRTGSFLLTPDAVGDTTASVLLDVPTDIDYYSITAPPSATGGLTVTTSASTFNQRLALFDAAGTLIQGPLVSLNIANVTPNAEYRIAVFSSNYATAGSLNLNIDFASNVAPVLSGFGAISTYPAGGTPVVIAPAAKVNDVDGGNFAGGYLVAKIVQNAGTHDRLTIRNQGTAFGQVSTSGNQVLVGGTAIGSFSGGSGSTPLKVLLNGNATPSRVQALLRDITYNNTIATPATARRVVQFQLNDGDGGTSNNALAYVDIVAGNKAPALFVGADLGYKLATAPIAVAPNATVSDPDSANFASGTLTVHISAGADGSNRLTLAGPVYFGGQDVYIGDVRLGRLATADAGVGTRDLVINLSPNATPANVQQLLRALRFSTNNDSLVAARQLEFKLLDGDGGTSPLVSKKIYATR